MCGAVVDSAAVTADAEEAIVVAGVLALVVPIALAGDDGTAEALATAASAVLDAPRPRSPHAINATTRATTGKP